MEYEREARLELALWSATADLWLCIETSKKNATLFVILVTSYSGA
jgi:hypothetical protein